MTDYNLKINSNLQKLAKANNFLHKALTFTPSDIQKAATIQAFEFTFELAWKTMKIYAQSKGVSVYGPRDAIREGLEANIINDAELWIVFMNARNMTSHTYLESVAEEVYAQATPLYQAVHDLIKSIKLKLIL